MLFRSSKRFLIDNKILLIVSFVSFILCGFNIFGYPIYILDEAKNTEAAREMLVNSNFIVPTFNNNLRTDKPPLHYFFMMLSYKIFGVGPLGARFFSAVFGALTIASTFYFTKKFEGTKAAYITVFILWSSVFFIQEFHLAVPDPYLIFFLSFSFFNFFNFHLTKKNKSLIISYISLALAVMAKGPFSLALFGLVVILFLIFTKQFNYKSIISHKPFLATFIILIICLPWYYKVHIETNGEWTKGFFLDHNLNRFGNEKEGHGGLFIITWLYVILGLMPFSFFIIQALAFGYKKRKEKEFILFCLIIALVIIGIFSISGTKLPNYPMPSFPFIAVLIAFYFVEIYKRGKVTSGLKWSFIFLVFISVILPVGGFIALTLEKQLNEVRFFSLTLSVVTIGTILSFLKFKKVELKKSFIYLSLSWASLSIILFGIVFPQITSQSPVSMAKKIIPPHSDIIVYKRMDSAFPINFQRTFFITDSLDIVLEFLSKKPQGYVITNAKKAETELNNVEGLKLTLLLRQKALFENHVTLIYTKRK
ncbi:ArnT family glycosyltransferase [Abyssalbus ytuae]|uniref:Glycosyltransferase family 39 protein n=1 Tax=Abyssalbus ytuae TaxID=2926907 RepID=A0A9E6ZJG6_9FLAO|nr:glycosyltransferase family 39 protein [Abyssalbus ytuae]UOB16709.1 glycosyltransferase family 39 protein [Abyssalbus ytuae]